MKVEKTGRFIVGVLVVLVGCSHLWAGWSGAGDRSLNEIQIKLRAGYTDGHVESYGSSDVTVMKVSITADGSVSYPAGVGAGDFYLPREN